MLLKIARRSNTLQISSKGFQGADTQLLQSGAHILPKGCVLLGVLKSIENELRKREMLGISGQPTTQLWFLAETERNIFLWRSGKSLDDQRNYSFWINVPALIKKRRYQLKKPQGLNPFTNPLWGIAAFEYKLVDQERDYLDSFEDLADSVLKHAEALSVASETIRSEVAPGSLQRPPVVLPSVLIAR